jgi:protein-S-isoprenylcysteine O-methyltransferase Ste14
MPHRVRSVVEQLRIRLSQLGGILLIGLVLVSESLWIESEAAEELMAVLGFLLACAGCLGRIWCLAHIAGSKTGHLTTHGPYSICRNPLYLFSLIGAIGIGLGTCTVTVPAIIVLFFVALYPWVIRSEERRLLELHDDAYERYCQVVPRIVPSFRHYKPASNVSIDIRAFRRGLLDAGWFLLAIGGTHVVTELREAGFGIALYKLP